MTFGIIPDVQLTAITFFEVQFTAIEFDLEVQLTAKNEINSAKTMINVFMLIHLLCGFIDT